MPEMEDDLPPTLDAIEEALTRNYEEFDSLRAEWNREWQRNIATRRQRRCRARKANGTPAVNESAA